MALRVDVASMRRRGAIGHVWGFGAGSGPARRAVRPPQPGRARPAARGDRLVVCLIVALTFLSPCLYDLGAR